VKHLANLAAGRSDRRWSRAAGWIASLAAHALVLAFALQATGSMVEDAEEHWIELELTPRTPPPKPEPMAELEPEPEQEPEPEPPPPPEPVPFEETVPEPVPQDVLAELDPAEPPPPPVRRVQGLSASSFAEGGDTGIQLRAGNSLALAAEGGGMTLEKAELAKEPLEYAIVTTAPRCRKPKLDVPASVRADGVEGTVSVLLDIGSDGAVLDVDVVTSLTPDADAACVAAWRTARCKPGRQDKSPVAVLDLPHSCTFRAIR